jgi:hypothetical protein
VAWGLFVLAVYWSAVRTSWGQHLDDGLLERFHSGDLVVRLVASAVRSGIPLALSVVVARLCLVAWRAGRRHAVMVVGSVLLVTVVLSPLLRDVLLTRPDLGTDEHNTLPSNHMAFSTALAGAVVVLRWCGARWAGLRQADGAGLDRRVGAGLAALLVVEAVVNVTTYAHRPADMVAGFAVAAMLWSLAPGVSPGLVSRRDASGAGVRGGAGTEEDARAGHAAACGETGGMPEV